MCGYLCPFSMDDIICRAGACALCPLSGRLAELR